MNFTKKIKKHVLVVDDEPLIVDMTCEFLQEAGFETAFAHSATQAMQEMEKKTANVMLLDIKLQNEDGLTFLKRFKKLYPDVPVVILTGVGYDENMLQTALKNGASAYISKDTEMENMVVAIKRLTR